MVEDAQLSARHYVVEAESGSQEVLYGISVFARRPEAGVATVLNRFTRAAAYVEVAIGRLRVAGFVTYATGVDPDHFDIQLISGLREDSPSASAEEVREAVARVLALAGPLQPNPAYSGRTLEEDR